MGEQNIVILFGQKHRCIMRVRENYYFILDYDSFLRVITPIDDYKKDDESYGDVSDLYS